jgi:hypothetical protein
MQPTVFNVAAAINSPTAKTISTIMNRTKKKEKVDSSQTVRVLTEQTTAHATGLSTPPAVIEYLDFPERSVKLIAANHGLTPVTLIHQARNAGVPGRRRGRKMLAVPPLDLQAAIRSLETQSYEQLAYKLGVSKARVGKVVDRWRDWIKENKLRIGRDRVKPRESPQVRQRREPKVSVLSFRLTESQVKELMKSTDCQPFNKRQSIHQVARSILFHRMGES